MQRCGGGAASRAEGRTEETRELETDPEKTQKRNRPKGAQRGREAQYTLSQPSRSSARRTSPRQGLTHSLSAYRTRPALLRSALTADLNLIIGSKNPTRTWLSVEEADRHCIAGASVWQSFSTDGGVDPDVVLVGIGVEVTMEIIAAAKLLQKEGIRVRVVNVVRIHSGFPLIWLKLTPNRRLT